MHNEDEVRFRTHKKVTSIGQKRGTKKTTTLLKDAEGHGASEPPALAVSGDSKNLESHDRDLITPPGTEQLSPPLVFFMSVSSPPGTFLRGALSHNHVSVHTLAKLTPSLSCFVYISAPTLAE